MSTMPLASSTMSSMDMKLMIQNVSFSSPIDVRSHNPPPSGSSVLTGTRSSLQSMWDLTITPIRCPASFAGTPPGFQDAMHERSFHTLIKNVSFFSPIDVRSHNPPPFRAQRTGKVAACTEHLVGDRSTIRSINDKNTVIGKHGLLSTHMPGYYHCIIKGITTIIVSYTSWNGDKMHTNHELINDYLKNTLNFRIMIPKNHTEFLNGLTYLVNSIAIPMSRRLLTCQVRDETANSIEQERRDLVTESVRKSLVLLRKGENANDPVLPLSKTTPKNLVAGTHAHNLGFQCSGWTISRQGLSGNNLTTGTTILDAAKKTVDPNTEVVNEVNPTTDYVKANNFSYAIVVVEELPYAETDGDNLNLTISEGSSDLIQNVCTSVKCLVVIVSNRSLTIPPLDRSWTRW
ncbi:hypothetical protein SDJN02_01854, partial [Cucurbita argyrosperma subsp. argyrosperma]